jgi:hypothetical protein
MLELTRIPIVLVKQLCLRKLIEIKSGVDGHVLLHQTALYDARANFKRADLGPQKGLAVHIPQSQIT